MKRYCVIPVCGFRAYFSDVVTATVWAYARANEGNSTKLIDENGIILGTFKTNYEDFYNQTVVVKIRGM